MSVTALTSPAYYRRETYAGLDSLGRIYLHGLICNQPFSDDFAHSYAERYDSTTHTWTVLAQPPKKIYQSAFIIDASDNVIETGAIVLNLNTGGGGAPPDSFLYSTASNTWTAIANSPVPGTQGENYLSWQYNNMLYIVVLDTQSLMYHYTGGTIGSWVSGSTLPPFVISSFISNPSWPNGIGLPIDANGLFLFGGGSTTVGALRYNPVTDAWTTTSVAPINTTTSTRIVWDNSRYLYYLTGSSSFVRYDTVLDTWATLTAPPFTFGRTAALVATSTTVYILGHADTFLTPTNVFPNIWAYDINAATWTDTGDVVGLTSSGYMRIPRILKDPFGSGYYLIEGPAFPTSFEGSNLFEYWVPVGTALSRTFATILG